MIEKEVGIRTAGLEGIVKHDTKWIYQLKIQRQQLLDLCKRLLWCNQKLLSKLDRKDSDFSAAVAAQVLFEDEVRTFEKQA